MAPVIVAAALGVAAQGAEMIAANQTSQKAKGQASDLLNKQTAQTFDNEANLSKTGAAAKTKALGAAASAANNNGTILTGPRGDGANPTPRKSLLGL